MYVRAVYIVMQYCANEKGVSEREREGERKCAKGREKESESESERESGRIRKQSNACLNADYILVIALTLLAIRS